MTLDYTKMFLIVTEEAVVKGHFAGMHQRQFVTSRFLHIDTAYPGSVLIAEAGIFIGMHQWQFVTGRCLSSEITSRFVTAVMAVFFVALC